MDRLHMHLIITILKTLVMDIAGRSSQRVSAMTIQALFTKLRYGDTIDKMNAIGQDASPIHYSYKLFMDPSPHQIFFPTKMVVAQPDIFKGISILRTIMI